MEFSFALRAIAVVVVMAVTVVLGCVLDVGKVDRSPLQLSYVPLRVSRESQANQCEAEVLILRGPQIIGTRIQQSNGKIERWHRSLKGECVDRKRDCRWTMPGVWWRAGSSITTTSA